MVLETAAGLIRVTATCRDGRCERVTFDGVPSFVEALDVPLSVPGLGDIRVDVAYGGCYYVFADPAQFGVKLDRSSARQVVEAGTAISCISPGHQRFSIPRYRRSISSPPMPIGDDDPPTLVARRDRASTDGRPFPVVTGNSAGCASCRSRRCPGRVAVHSAPLIDSEFSSMIVDDIFGDRTRGAAAISGRGWVVGTHTSTVEATDPYQFGYVLSDVWGDEVGSL